MELVSDTQWEAARRATERWQETGEAADGWLPAKDLGPIGAAPWRLEPAPEACPELYPPYEETARLLADMNVPPDLESDGPVRYTHRRAEGLDLYFVANRTGEAVEAACTFRVAAMQPELWDPLTGQIRDLARFEARGSRTIVPMRFEPYQSFLVLFRRPARATPGVDGAAENFPRFEALGQLGGRWRVSFDPKLGGPGEVAFDALEDWSQRPEQGIKYYSGIATYRRRFDLPEQSSVGNRRILLDLGVVHNVARVRLNDRDLGVVWCAPWQIDVTDAVQKLGNHLEIDVANLWPNRLIGDQALPENERISWTTFQPYKADSPLLPSGLLGPVTLGKMSPLNARGAGPQ